MPKDCKHSMQKCNGNKNKTKNAQAKPTGPRVVTMAGLPLQSDTLALSIDCNKPKRDSKQSQSTT